MINLEQKEKRKKIFFNKRLRNNLEFCLKDMNINLMRTHKYICVAIKLKKKNPTKP